MPTADLTLQINLCAGDLAYAGQTVAALVAAHRSEVAEVLAVADACRPQSTPYLQSDSRFPERGFRERVERLREYCRRGQESGLFDRVAWLEPGDASGRRRLNLKYAGVATALSHDHRGHAFSAYFAGWEGARTRYVVHYDADILLHQEPGFSWAAEAIGRCQLDPAVVAVSPRLAPPRPGRGASEMLRPDRPDSGWHETWRLDPSPEGWRSEWLSTRCHLIDRTRLETLLPLIPARGRGRLRIDRAINALLLPTYRREAWARSRILRRLAASAIPPFPLPPEVLFHENALRRGFHCLYLRSEKAWYLHPDPKGQLFLDLLPLLVRSVRDGRHPPEQAGMGNLQLEAWRSGTLMSQPLRRLGLGRALYHSWHRPRAMIAESFRQGGPWEQWRTAQGRRAMEEAARTVLPPLEAPPPETPAVPVHVLTGRKLWYQTAFMAHSLARLQPVRLVVHDDGSLTGAALASLRRILPFARFVPAAETEARLDSVLPASRYPTLRRRREELVLFRKLLDVHAGAAGWRLFLDSDMLFFHRPEQLSGWLSSPLRSLHMTDADRAYGYDLGLLSELAGRPVPDLVNTGILGLQSEAIDWDRLEAGCRGMIERAGTHYYQEQAVVALHLARVPHDALPRQEYLVLPEPPEAGECRAVVHHYVAGSKAWYFRQNWRRMLPPGPS